MPSARAETGLVLPGGGARAAYRVGTLRAIARVLGKAAPHPFPVISGTSAGAINAAVLGANADSFRRGVCGLLRWWRTIRATARAIAVTFYDAMPALSPWHRVRRRGERCRLGDVEHVMASAAIPLVFPAVRIGADYYMDGSVRQIAPLAPALHLGAARIVVIAVGQFSGQSVAQAAPRYPSLGQIAGHALSSVFLDNLAADLERLHAINRLAAMTRARGRAGVRHVDVLALAPSADLGAVALRYAHRLPRAVRHLLRGLGSTRGTGANLLSYLLFELEYCRALMRMGFDDAMARRDEIVAFLAESSVNFVPLFPPECR